MASPARGCALSQPRARDGSNPSIQPQDVLEESNTRGYRARITAGSTLQLLQPAEDLGPAASGAAAEPWEEQSSSSSAELNCHTLVPFPGKQRFLRWTETEAEVITEMRYDAAGLGQTQAAPGTRRELQEQQQPQSCHIPALTRTQTLQLPSSNMNTEPLRALPKLLCNSHGAILGCSHRKMPLEAPYILYFPPKFHPPHAPEEIIKHTDCRLSVTGSQTLLQHPQPSPNHQGTSGSPLSPGPPSPNSPFSPILDG